MATYIVTTKNHHGDDLIQSLEQVEVIEALVQEQIHPENISATMEHIGDVCLNDLDQHHLELVQGVIHRYDLSGCSPSEVASLITEILPNILTNAVNQLGLTLSE